MEQSVPFSVSSETNLYQRYKKNKEEGQMDTKFDMVTFLENYKKGVDFYNSYGLEKGVEKKEN